MKNLSLLGSRTNRSHSTADGGYSVFCRKLATNVDEKSQASFAAASLTRVIVLWLEEMHLGV